MNIFLTKDRLNSAASCFCHSLGRKYTKELGIEILKLKHCLRRLLFFGNKLRRGNYLNICMKFSPNSLNIAKQETCQLSIFCTRTEYFKASHFLMR